MIGDSTKSLVLKRATATSSKLAATICGSLASRSLHHPAVSQPAVGVSRLSLVDYRLRPKVGPFFGTPINSKNVFLDGTRFNSSAAGDEKEIPVPPMGDSISEGALSHWTKSVGEYIAADEIIAVVDTDKVSVDILSPESGIISSFAVEEGETVFVGEPLFSITPGNPEDAVVVEKESAAEAAEDAAAPTSTRSEKIVPMSRMRLRIAERLKGAQDNAAALTTFNEVDLGELMAMRVQYNDLFQKQYGVKLGFMSPFIIACAKAIQRNPDVGAILDGTNLVYKNYVDISVAVATPSGLMVPVVRDCDKKSFHDLEKELVELAGRARNGQITLDEMQGGSFTISNGGIYGSMMGTPLLNPPQSAILGMHTITNRPITRDGKIVTRPMMYLAMTYDHQVIDGREAVTFLKNVKEYLEDPRRLLLNI